MRKETQHISPELLSRTIEIRCGMESQ